jgi:hypothetical protein
MGLLNMGPQDEALLALGLGLLNSKGSFGNALGQSGMQAMQTLNQAKEREQLAKQRARQEQMAQMQLEQVQRQQAEQQAAKERDARFMGAIAPVGPGQAASMPGGPTPQNAQQIGQGPDWRSLALQFPDKADLIAKLAGAKNFGRDEVKEFVETPDGRQGVSKYGDRVGTPLALPPDIQLLNLGGKTVGVDKRRAAGQSFAHTQTPDSIASNAVTMRGQNMTDARARETTAATLTKPFEVTGPDGLPMLVQQDKQGNLRKVEGFGPKSGSAKPLTDAQAKALLFGSRAKEADRLINDLNGKYSPLAVNAKTSAGNFPLIGGALEATANTLTSSENQQAEQAQRDFVNAVLRRESGAVISDPEFNNAKKQYFPQPGDSEATLQQKARNRALAVDGMLAEVPVGQRSQLDRKPSGAGGGWTVTEVK